VLELCEIGVRLGAFELTDLSLTVEAGEYVVLLGPSGVGKTVLLETIAGVRPLMAGAISLDGQDLSSIPPERRPISIVHQDYALFPHMTVAGNIGYGLRSTGVSRPQIRERVNRLADLLGITPLLRRRPVGLSGGEQQRVALARALAVEPRVLLLDEPLSALDANVRAQLRQELKRINRELQTAFIHVTHDPEEAMTLADRIGVMLDRRLCQIDSPEELFRRPSDAAVAAFLGMRNVLSVTDRHDSFCRVNGAEIHVSSLTDTTTHIWIKPEEIFLSAEPFASSARNQFKCHVVDWTHRDSLLSVRVAAGELSLAALITYGSFEQLGIEAGREVYATFKSSAVHCL
jgi:molybdate/tungstate transport system ATP-binding protein